MYEEVDYSLIVIVGVILIILVTIVFCVVPILTKTTISGEIHSLQIEDGETHIVIQKNNGTIEVFTNSDSLIWLKFNSSDILSQLQVGCRVRIEVDGVRIPILSFYRNIIKADSINCP